MPNTPVTRRELRELRLYIVLAIIGLVCATIGLAVVVQGVRHNAHNNTVALCAIVATLENGARQVEQALNDPNVPESRREDFERSIKFQKDLITKLRSSVECPAPPPERVVTQLPKVGG
jgi:hypothetical protein